MNIVTVLLLLAVVALVVLSVWLYRRQTRKGGCAGGCTGCSQAGNCPSQATQPRDHH